MWIRLEGDSDMFECVSWLVKVALGEISCYELASYATAIYVTIQALISNLKVAFLIFIFRTLNLFLILIDL